MDWQYLLNRAITTFEYIIISYALAINTIYFLLMIAGYFTLRRRHDRLTADEREIFLRSSLAPAVSVLAPAYNEAATVRDSVGAMLKLHYPRHEVVVINDGSKDDTLEILIREFHLYKSARYVPEILPTQPIKAVYESRLPIRLVVVDKVNGGKADSLNAGLNAARSPLVAAVDSDSLLEPDSLLWAVKPFLEDPERTLASSGIIRVVNGCEVRDGRVATVNACPSLIARFQAVEYLRAFLGSRVAFSLINSLMVISGAFGLFRREDTIAAGGFTVTTVGEDMELVVRLHRLWRQEGRPYRIVFLPDPVCWTEVPETLKILQRQRNRWQRGAFESLRLNHRMIGNPKYGMVGLFGAPYFALFEMFGPMVELTGYVLTILGLWLGIVWKEIALLFFVACVAYGIFLSVCAVALEELTLRRYPKASDLAKLFWAAVIENLGFRQLLTIWRAKGLIDGFRGKKGWGAMIRRGFQPAPTP